MNHQECLECCVNPGQVGFTAEYKIPNTILSLVQLQKNRQA